eukprot:TRINITY_DN8331_c0_g1_i1.p1 TRINITY_DN8331_c0_g1~~TRINITY_DN8331_c0_g1_i1.p1  ORF type:complete len:108 (-),score=11.12 TRINITY_DN8331_c0_g1_i1:191-514(-)
MSYIYGDDDSEHHKLPEYSNTDNQNENNNQHFEPKLPELVENDNEEKYDMNQGSDDEMDMKGNVDMEMMNKQHSDSSKLTIKIYPPALQSVASSSPVDNTPDQHYID